MDSKQLFRKYYGRLAREGVLRALIWGLAAGLIVFALTTFACWAVDFTVGIVIAALLGVALTVALTCVLYYRSFRPTTEQIARRLDSLGLQERIITMTELSKDESYIAMRQREDAQRSLQNLNEGAIGCRVSRASVGFVSASGAVAIAMTAIFVLSSLGILPSGSQIFNPPEYIYVSLSYYLNGKGGEIKGETEQSVLVGDDAQSVLAVADEGYMFIGWSDGLTSPTRQDKNVQENMAVYPRFVEMDFDMGEDDVEDVPDDVPGDGDGDSGGPPLGDDTAGSSTNDSGNIIDGATDYNDVYESYYQEALDRIESGDLTEEEKAFLEAYFGSLK